MRIIRNKTFTTIILTILVLCFSQVASAQTGLSGYFDPVPGDLSIKVLQQIFGELFGGGNDPLSNAILVFNGCVLFVGGILAGYTMILGIIGTAHDGEMLGKELSSAWVPMRYTFGVALIMPVSYLKGYCLAQMIVAWLITMGVGIADVVWVSYAAEPAQQANTTMLLSGKEKVVELAENLYKTEYCLLAEKQGLNNRYWKFGNTTGDITWHEGKGTTVTGESKDYVWAGLDTIQFDGMCGYIKYLDSNDVAVGNAPSSTGTMGTNNAGRLGDLSSALSLGGTVNLSGIVAFHNQQIQVLRQKMQALASQTFSMKGDAFEKNKGALYAQIIKASVEYSSAIEQKANDYTHSIQSGTTGTALLAENNGWFLAGTWFMKQAFLSETINRSVNTLPTVIYKGNAALNWANNGVTDQYANVVVKTGQNAINDIVTNVYSGTNELYKEINKDDLPDGDSIASIGAGLAKVFTKIDIGELKSDPRHPIIIMTEMGQRLIYSTTATMAVITTAVGALSIKIAGFGMETAGIVITVMSMMLPLFFVLWTAAFVMTNLLPMLPFIIWFGAIIGWTILVVEAIIAAPLWCVMHLHPKGSDIVGAAGKGYSLVLALLLRPVLLIFGFISGLVLTEVFGELLNKVFFQVWASSMNGVPTGGLSAFIQPLFGTVIYCALMFILISKMFTTATLIADQLLKWMGGPTEQLGQFADAFTQRGNQAMAGAAAFTNQAASQTVKAGGGVVSALKGLGDKNKADQENSKNRTQSTLNHALQEMGAKGEAYEVMSARDGKQADGNLDDLNNSIRDFGGNSNPQAQQMVSGYNSNREAGQDHTTALKGSIDQTLGEGAYDRIQAARSQASEQGTSINKAGRQMVSQIKKEKAFGKQQ